MPVAIHPATYRSGGFLVHGMLNAKYQKVLPDVSSDITGYVRNSTNILICIGGKNEDLSDLEKVKCYFAQVQIELKRGNVKPNDVEKINFCKIAEEAISEIIKKTK